MGRLSLLARPNKVLYDESSAANRGDRKERRVSGAEKGVIVSFIQLHDVNLDTEVMVSEGVIVLL